MPIDRQRDLLAFRGLVSGNITELTDNEVQIDTRIGSGSNFLSNLSRLERVDASNISSFSDTATSTFEGCAELKYARLYINDIPSKTFYNCAKLQEVSFPLATRINGNAFRGCVALTTLSLPSATTIGVYAFGYCHGLVNVTLPSVTALRDNAFDTCSNLVNVTLPNVTSIGSKCFYKCSKLVAIDLGASVTTIYSGAFSVCSSLLHLIIRNTNAVCANNFASSDDPSNSQLKIYVPRALLDSYKTATNWSRLADKFVALEDHTVDGTTTGELVT